MNLAHIHLMINHFPVIGIAFGIFLLIWAIIMKKEEVKRVSFGIFVIIALIAFPVYFTGEPAEEIVEHLPGVKESIIEEHEEMALIALVFIEILGVIAATGLFLSFRSKSFANWFVAALLILSVVSGGLMAKTANIGGQIRHTEIRKDFQLSISESHHYEHDDD